ncbi:MAG: glycosyltransferase [Patescibacteria group bacterium]
MDLSRLSIIVPTKNEEKNIVRFLKSIPAGIEVILIDASTDQTLELAEAARPEIITIRNSELNIAAARQHGATYSKRDWLLFTDSDIHFSPLYFKHILDLPVGDAYYGEKRTASSKFRTYDFLFRLGQGIIDRLGIPSASGSNMIIHKQAFTDVGGFDIELSCNEDTEIFFRLHKQKKHIQFVPQLVVVSHDDRRLESGVVRKLTHSFLRSVGLYFDILNKKQRNSDWGYWK